MEPVISTLLKGGAAGALASALLLVGWYVLTQLLPGRLTKQDEAAAWMRDQIQTKRGEFLAALQQQRGEFLEALERIETRQVKALERLRSSIEGLKKARGG